MRPLQKNPLRGPAPTGASGPIKYIQIWIKHFWFNFMRQNRLSLMASTASLWPIPLVDLPLIDMTLSPLLARPSTEAGEEGRTRWTWWSEFVLSRSPISPSLSLSLGLRLVQTTASKWTIELSLFFSLLFIQLVSLHMNKLASWFYAAPPFIDLFTPLLLVEACLYSPPLP